MEIGDFDASEREQKRSLVILKEIGAQQFLASNEWGLAEFYLRMGRNADARKHIVMATESAVAGDLPRDYVPLFYGVLKAREGDRAKGLAWVGYTRKHETHYGKEVGRDIERFRAEIQGDPSDGEYESALRAGEDLKLDDIIAEATGVHA